ncbi:MAG TPA: hypothetical protein VF498_08440, partial [Anaerolineales bacterium]
TGIAILQDGQVIYTADEPTGGTHFSLVIAGSLGIRYEEAEALKTDLAYEKANRLGLKLVQEKPDSPPSAPVRPYISQQSTKSSPGAGSYLPAQPVGTAAAKPSPTAADLHQRIRSAVVARLGNQIDPALLDVIIQRVLNSTGVK